MLQRAQPFCKPRRDYSPSPSSRLSFWSNCRRLSWLLVSNFTFNWRSALSFFADSVSDQVQALGEDADSLAGDAAVAEVELLRAFQDSCSVCHAAWNSQNRC